MRLVTWNCCRGTLERKLPLLDRWPYDVAVVQECARPAAPSDAIVWTGDDPLQGMAVVAGAGYTLTAVPLPPDLPRYVLPVQVSGPVSFFLIAIWAQREPTYVEPTFRAAEAFAERIAAEPTVIIGDLNSNALWNRKRHPTRDHAALVEYLGGLGLVSGYHHWTGEAHGAERQPTFYFHWRESEPFHLDYCFVPRRWAERIAEVRVGEYAGWKDASDHRPLLVDVDPTRDPADLAVGTRKVSGP